ncbi:MAG: transglutaminase-like domain-containing protein [Candidatus Sumerlaeota bacterium]|nr:transglutaminase-like domain-containing protein [Candidatus Sumerlaeota bacterium]
MRIHPGIISATIGLTALLLGASTQSSRRVRESPSQPTQKNEAADQGRDRKGIDEFRRVFGHLMGEDTPAAPIPRKNAPGERVVSEAVFELSMFNLPIGRMRAQEIKVQENGREHDGARASIDVAFARMGDQTAVSLQTFEVYDDSGQLSHFKNNMRMSGVVNSTEGWVENGQCRVVMLDGATSQTSEQSVPWDPEAVSQKQMEDDFKRLLKGPVGGTVFHKVFLPELLPTRSEGAPTTSTLRGVETRPTCFGPKELYKVEVLMDLGTSVVTNSWVDGKSDLYEQETLLGPFKMTAKRISGKEPAPPMSSMSAEIFEPTTLKLSKPLANPEKIRHAIYRLKFNQGKTPRIYEDESQHSLGVEGDTLRLEVTSRKPGRPFPMSEIRVPPDGEAYLKPSPFVQSEDPEIVKAAWDAVGEETDAWKRAKALEKWVNGYVREKDLGVAFASAKETMQTRQGDCTEHATLLVALCRAVGIPARAAEGLVYARSIGGFGYHMWTQVYLDSWYNLDATRPQPDATDATHIEYGSSALDAPLAGDLALQILKFFGQFQIEVEKAE